MVINYQENIAHTSSSGKINCPGFLFLDSKGIAANPSDVLPANNSLNSLGELLQNMFVFSSASVGSVNSAYRWGSGEVLFKSNEFNEHPLRAHMGAWKGEDIDKVLEIVHKSRSKF
jgi:hypothetical protein